MVDESIHRLFHEIDLNIYCELHRDEGPAASELRRTIKGLLLGSFSDKRPFVPRSKLVLHVTPDRIEEILKELKSTSLDKIRDMSEKIANECRQLFSILLYCRKSRYIVKLLDQGIGDRDLPLSLTASLDKSSMILTTAKGKRVDGLERWDLKSLKCLESDQYRFWIPLLHERGEYKLLEKQILPIKILRSPITRKGSTSIVTQANIPNGGIYYGKCSSPEDLLVAIKISESRENFEFEQMVYRRMRDYKRHPHLTDFLFSYEKGDADYGLVFPWADKGSLLEYWEAHHQPQFNRKMLLWFIEQLTGIASGLDHLHSIHDADNPKNLLFVRHADIKPANILLFSVHSDIPSPGIAKIADLGLAHVDGDINGPNANPESIATHTYSPPDAQRGKPISQTWDIWSFGCFGLEFAGWILRGFRALGEFSDMRLADEKFGCYNTDDFYSSDLQSVRPSVHNRINELQGYGRRSRMIQDVLDVIKNEMIVLEPEERSPTSVILEKFDQILNKSRNDPAYLLRSYDSSATKARGTWNSTRGKSRPGRN